MEDLEEGNAETKSSIMQAATSVISAKKLMLKDYFSVEVDHDNNLCAVPCLLGWEFEVLVSAIENITIKLHVR